MVWVWRAATARERERTPAPWRSRLARYSRLHEIGQTGHELQRHGVQTIPQARRSGTVVEDVSEVGVAPTTHNLSPNPESVAILEQRDRVLVDGAAET